MKKLLLLLMSFMVTEFCVSQTISLKGLVKEIGTKETIPSANIVWMKPDSSFVSGTTTTINGTFRLAPIQEKDGIVCISCIGYDKLYMDVKGIYKSVDLGELFLVPSSISLTGVEIKASSVIHSVDRQVFFLSDDQIKKSINGLEATRRLGLPRILVNPQENTISMLGGEQLKILINGVEASSQEVASLLPKDIKRVEYFDNPGLRYGEEIGGIINYITQKQETGGSLSAIVNETLTRSLGFGYFSGGVNMKHSQLKFSYQYSHNNMYSGHYREQSFNFPDNNNTNRIENGENHWNQIVHSANVTYSYIKDKDFFNAKFNGLFVNTPHSDLFSSLSYTNKLYPGSASDSYQEYTTNRPSLDLYYSRSLPKQQTLSINLVGTYSKNNNGNQYTEYSDNNGSILSSYLSNVDGRRYSLIAEACYEKKYTKGVLTGGLRYTGGHTKNLYTGTYQFETKMLDTELYGFVQYNGTFHKLNYMGALGISYVNINQKDEESYTTWKFCPRLSLNYNFSSAISLRYTYSLQNKNPSLSYLSDVEQQMDNFRVTKGNPYLHSYFYHRNVVDFNINTSFIRTGLTFGSYLYTDPIMEETIFDNPRSFFIKTYNNQNKFHRMKAEWTIGCSLFKKHLDIDSYIGYGHSISEAYNYKHTFNDFYYMIQIMANYKNWELTFIFLDDTTPFWGETVSPHNFFDSYGISYRFSWGKIGISSYNLFGEKGISKSYDYNRFTPNSTVTDMNNNYPSVNISLSLNLDWGRKARNKRQTLQNSDTVNGILQ